MLFGLGASYKPFAIIIIIALVMAYGARCIGEWRSEHETSNKRINSLVILFVCFALMSISYNAMKAAVANQTEKEFDIQLDMGASTPHFLLVGLNTQGEGQISEGTLSREYYQYYLDNGQDTQAAKQHAYSLLKKDWKENKIEVPKLFIKKAIWAWQDDVIPAIYLGNCIDEKGKQSHASLFSWLIETTPEVSQAYYLLIMLLSFVGVFSYIKKHTVSYDIEFIELIVFGFFCLLMLSEAQSRYKCLIMPYVCILSTMGISAIMNAIVERKKKLYG